MRVSSFPVNGKYKFDHTVMAYIKSKWYNLTVNSPFPERTDCNKQTMGSHHQRWRLVLSSTLAFSFYFHLYKYMYKHLSRYTPSIPLQMADLTSTHILRNVKFYFCWTMIIFCILYLNNCSHLIFSMYTSTLTRARPCPTYNAL